MSASTPLNVTQAEWQALVAERDRYLSAIEAALRYWPGEAHFGKAYYALLDALGSPFPGFQNAAWRVPRA